MYKLILIEDDYQIRTGLSTFFPWNEIGFQLTGSFENGRQALDYIRKNNRIDVVLSDIKMPVMDGLEFTVELKKTNPDTPVIFLTAYRDFNYAHQALNNGVKQYIVKSTRFEELTSVFKKIKTELDYQNQCAANSSLPKVTERSAAYSNDDRLIQKVKEHALSDISNATLQSLAEHVSLNPIYLSRYFKEKTGMNFIDYIIRIKMEKAAALLKEKNFKILDISELVGYSNEKNFSRAFKKYYGVCPINYRKII